MNKMPSVAQEGPELTAAKKRKLDDEGYFEVHLQRRAPVSHINNNKSPRKIISLPANKRVRLAEQSFHEHHRYRSRSPDIARQTTQQHCEAAEAWPDRVHQGLRETDPNSRSAPPTRTNSAALLTRCHICHRKPAKLADLDSFADCQNCGKRACFVCIRECIGWTDPLHYGDESRRQGEEDLPEEEDSVGASMHMTDGEPGGWEGHQVDRNHKDHDTARPRKGWVGGGHQRTICSACCVERGPDGDVVCLGCLPYVDG
jgi:hypothetical protein